MSAQAGAYDRSTVVQQYRRHVNGGLARLAEFMAAPVEARSAGSRVYDEHGQSYLDCGGYGVFLLGHAHPTVVGRVRAQLERHALATRVLLNPELAAAAERLARVAPSGLDYVLFTNSGAEAVEAALKLARLAGCRRVIAMQGGYHGKTLGALSVTGRLCYQTPFAPLLPEVEFIPYGDLGALEQALAPGQPPSCVILEPLQAEGGVHAPPEGYLRAVRAACTRAGAFLVVDEIQTGLGRTGAWWACDAEGVVPEVLLAGKILSGGLVPVAAAIASPAAYAQLNRDPLLHSSTFAGNPLAMAAVQGTLQAIEEEGLVERARTLGERLLPALRDILRERCPEHLREVRGRGLLIGVEFHAEHLAGEFMMALLEQHVIVCHSLNAQRVVRLTPPAILTGEECDWLLKAVEHAATALHEGGRST